MAITLIQQPQDYMPAFNYHWWEASSDKTAQPNFRYTIVVTDVISSTSETYQINARPDGKLVFDSGVFARTLVQNFIPENEYGWRLASIREIKVNIGESYDGSPEYHAGADVTYYTWNGVIDFLPFANYDYTDFTYAPTLSRRNWLSSSLDEITYTDKSNYLYLIVEETNKFYGIRILTYDSLGNNIGSSDIDHTLASPSYADNYSCIDVGLKGLTNIASGDVTGTYPIIAGNEAYYEIYERYNDGSLGQVTLLKTITIECEPTFDVKTIHYLAKNGNFQTVHFNKMSTKTSDKNQVYYKKFPYTLTASGYTYERSTGIDRVLSTETSTKLLLNTDWITEEEMSLYMDLFDSPVIYLDEGSSIGYASLKCTTNQMQETKRYNKRIFNLTCEFEYNHTNSRQY